MSNLAMGEPRTVDVLVIGGGPAGLTAATRLAQSRPGGVLVLEREAEAGGIPRHSDHLGYGVRDLRRILSGPTYARRLVATAAGAGARIETASMVTGWSGSPSDRTVEVTSPAGRYLVRAAAIILATGARERPRTARLVPGDRPAGVLTTGQLQNLIYLHRRPAGSRAVVVGSELVSWSAVLTLRHAGTRTVLMTTRHERAEVPRGVPTAGRLLWRVPVACGTRVARVIGRGRVEAVEIEDLGTGSRLIVECDTVVFTGDWIADLELARAASLDLAPAGAGPVVDAALRTSQPGVFAVGNLVHPVDTADVAALDGRHAVTAVLSWLDHGEPLTAGLTVNVDAPLKWVSPGRWVPGAGEPSRGRLLAWTKELVRHPLVVARQDGVVVGRVRVPWPASPGRVFRIPASVLRAVRPDRGDVTMSLE